MTLATRLAVTTPGVDARALFEKLVILVGGREKLFQACFESDTEVLHASMPMGLGLSALCSMTASLTSKPLPLEKYESSSLAEVTLSRARWDSLSLEEKYEEKEYLTYLTYHPEAYILLTFDTSYAYQAPNGAGCGDFHAWLLRELGALLEEEDASWTWYDESGWGWREEWEENPEVMLKYASPWGTLGDPDYGDPESLIPVPTEDERQLFLQALLEKFDLREKLQGE